MTTLARPPVVRTTAAAVDRDAATLNGAATPNGAETTGWFRYSDAQPAACDDTFGTRTADTMLGTGNSEVVFSAQVTGLERGTYYYCAIASNSAGQQFGEIQAFAAPGAGGCGCTEAGGLLAPGALALALLLRRRRRSRQPGATS